MDSLSLSLSRTWTHACTHHFPERSEGLNYLLSNSDRARHDRQKGRPRTHTPPAAAAAIHGGRLPIHALRDCAHYRPRWGGAGITLDIFEGYTTTDGFLVGYPEEMNGQGSCISNYVFPTNKQVRTKGRVKKKPWPMCVLYPGADVDQLT